MPGETWPNRNFAHAGTSDGEANINFGFCYDKTIFEQLMALDQRVAEEFARSPLARVLPGRRTPEVAARRRAFVEPTEPEAVTPFTRAAAKARSGSARKRG